MSTRSSNNTDDHATIRAIRQNWRDTYNSIVSKYSETILRGERKHMGSDASFFSTTLPDGIFLIFGPHFAFQEEYCPISSADVLVDMGGGTGLLAMQIAATTGCQSYSIEYNPSLIAAGETALAYTVDPAYPGLRERVHLVQADLIQLDDALQNIYNVGSVFFMTNTNFAGIEGAVLDSLAKGLISRVASGNGTRKATLITTEPIDKANRSARSTVARRNGSDECDAKTAKYRPNFLASKELPVTATFRCKIPKVPVEWNTVGTNVYIYDIQVLVG